MKALIEGGAEVNARNSGGYTAIHRASFMGYERTVRELIKAGANVNIEDNRKGTPLHEAAFMREIGNVRAIIEAGGNVNARNDKGYIPLHLVCIGGEGKIEVGIIEELIKAGADVNALCDRGMSPMYRARNNERITEVLKKYGGKVINKSKELEKIKDISKQTVGVIIDFFQNWQTREKKYKIRYFKV